MEEQIKKIYEKQKKGRIRMIRNVLLIYVALICIVSIFKENPFPHQETVLFFNVKQSGWITTDSYLLWGCAVLDLIVVMLIEICNILREFSKIDRMLSQECDAEKYLEMLEGMIKYGKSLDYGVLPVKLDKLNNENFFFPGTVYVPGCLCNVF